MTWTQLLANNEVRRHTTSRSELNDLRTLVNRDLADAEIKGLSADRRFATAYNAALQTAKMVIGCAGYRVTTGPGHHQITFESVKLALGKAAGSYADYFEICRRKRNTIDYDYAHVATETEAQEIVARAKDFFSIVEQWVAREHPSLKP
jgi:hypothetical protein